MLKFEEVKIEAVKGINNEYIIKDNVGITIGRVYIIELEKSNKYCSFRIRFYKYGDESYFILKNSLSKFLRSLFNNGIYKVNAIADEDINIAAFVDLGFELEGIITNSIIKNNIHMDEMMFGIDSKSFQSTEIKKNNTIVGKNISLRVLTPEDTNDIFQYYIRNKNHLKYYEPTREEDFYTHAVQRRNLIEGYKQFLNGVSVNFGIYKDNEFIGKIQLSNIVMGVFKSAFVGYSIDKDEQGKGYMKEAVKLAIEYGFLEIGLHRVEASTLVDNIKSQKVLKACGFKQIGISEKYLFINGKWRDHLIFYKVNDNI